MTSKAKAKRKAKKLRIFKVHAMLSFAGEDWQWHKGCIEAKLKEWGAKDIKVRLR